LSELAAEVEKNEPGCISYQFFYNEADSEFAVFEMLVALSLLLFTTGVLRDDVLIPLVRNTDIRIKRLLKHTRTVRILLRLSRRAWLGNLLRRPTFRL
jgi:hypothetical protein